MIYKRLEENQLNEWYALCGSVFSEDADYFRAHFELDPWRDVNSIFVAEDKGKLVASVRVFYRKIYYEGHKIPMAGIGEVCTDPSYRKQGISNKLLQMAVAFIDASNFQISALSTGLHQHYGKVGYSVQKRYFNQINTKDLVISDTSSITLKNAVLDDSILMNIDSIYDDYSKGFNGPIVRNSMDYWRKWFVHEVKKENRQIKLILQEEALIGYVVYEKEDTFGRIIEYGSTSKVIEHSVLAHISHETNQASIVIPAVIQTDLTPEKVLSDDHWMYRDCKKEHYLMQQNNCIDKHCSWRIDSF